MQMTQQQRCALLMKRGVNPFQGEMPPASNARVIKGRHPQVSTLMGRHRPQMTCGDLTMWGDK